MIVHGVHLSDEERARIYNPFGQHNGLFIPDWLIGLEGVTPLAKMIFGRLGKYSGRDGSCFPKGETLAEEFKVTERHVTRCISELVNAGLLLRKIRGAGRSNVYFFLIPKDHGKPIFEADKTDVESGKKSSLKSKNRTTSKSKKPDLNVCDKQSKNRTTPTYKSELPRPTGREHIRNKENHLKRITIESDQFAEDGPNLIGLYGKSQYKFFVSIHSDLEYPEFKKAYQEYLDYMKDQFTVYKSVMAIEKDFQQLAAFKRQGSDPVEVINQTIRSCGRNFYPIRKFDEQVKEVRGSGPNWGLM